MTKKHNILSGQPNHKTDISIEGNVTLFYFEVNNLCFHLKSVLKSSCLCLSENLAFLGDRLIMLIIIAKKKLNFKIY